MNYEYQTVTQDQQKLWTEYAEKRAVRRTALYIGIAYIILLVIPILWGIAFVPVMCAWGFSFESSVGLLEDPAFMHVLQIVLSALMFTLPFAAVLSGEHMRVTEAISFRKPKKGLFLPYVLIAIGLCAFANIATNQISSIFSSFGIYFTSPEMENPPGVSGVILVLLSTAFTPALVEEFAMRGVVMGALKKYGEEFAVLISAAIFGLMHGNFVQIPFAFLVGLAIGFAVMKTRSIWTGVVIHFFNNFISVVLGYFVPENSSMLYQNTVFSVYFALCILCTFIGLYLLNGKGEDAVLFGKSQMQTPNARKCGWFFSSPIIVVCILLTLLECIFYM